MIIFFFAKINLGLNILNKRKDNYHNIQTLFYPISISDFIEVKKQKGKNNIVFKSNNQFIDRKKNTITDAYNLMLEEQDLPSFSVYLHKRIPIGSGLGGGSSNGFFFLKYLFDYLSIENDSLLLEKSKRIGSDCSFFYYNHPIIAQGKGDVFKKINFSLKGYFLLMVYPNILINTSKAYTGFTNQKNNSKSYYDLNNIQDLKINDYKKYIYNDFESILFDDYPVLSNIKDKMYEKGAIYASLTGSGSTMFGIFENKEKIDLSLFSDSFSWIESI